MATYPTLRNGSSGSDVLKLQQALVNAGYSVGNAGVDGIYGSATESAVRQYQRDNGLSVDGVAGQNTLGSLYSVKTSTTPSTSDTTANQSASVPDYKNYSYDPASDDAYQKALAALLDAQKDKPTYSGAYDQQLEALYQNIINRDKFSYDLNSDALYQQYADQYTQRGKMAMMDTVGQTAALTGGYGNSYGTTAGYQAYQNYLQQLNDVVPELYGLALDQYNAEGDQLTQQYAMLGDLRDDEYGRYQDALNAYWQDVTYAKGEADDAYNRGYENWLNAYNMGQDAYNRLAELIANSGYVPGEAELAAAGMTASQAAAYRQIYIDAKNAAASGGGGSGSGGYYSSGSTSYDPTEDAAMYVSQSSSSASSGTYTKGSASSVVSTGKNTTGTIGGAIMNTSTASGLVGADKLDDAITTNISSLSANARSLYNSWTKKGTNRSSWLGAISAARRNGYITEADANTLRQLAPAK